MNTVCIVIGTRPEAIKMAPVVMAMRGREGVRVRLCCTGQHTDMVEDALRCFGIQAGPGERLWCRETETLSRQLGRMLMELDDYLGAERPSMVLVQGDTTSALAGAMAAFYRKTPVGHVEAGLRSGNPRSPWPEEANRRMISHLADLHFAPTSTAADNLKSEGIAPSAIVLAGNTVVDAVRWMSRQLPHFPAEITMSDGSSVALGNRPLILVTAHRRENHGDGLASICAAVDQLARHNPMAAFVWPVHPNPVVHDPVHAMLGHGNVYLIDPVDYRGFVSLLNRCDILLTDSGGLQEEGAALGKPVLVMRDSTERPEGVACGAAKLVGTDTPSIVSQTSRLLSDPAAYRAMAHAGCPYGDGTAGLKIADACVEMLSK